MARLSPRLAAAEAFKRLHKAYPDAKVELRHAKPLEVLVGTMLSPPCTGARVNQVTPALFKKYGSAADYANADLKTLEREIHSTGFYKNKAKNIVNTCKIIVERHGGRVPESMAELTELPGVARKTANIVLTAAFGIVEGIPVDTHVWRVSQRLGLTKFDDQDKIERDLCALLPRGKWWPFSTLLIWHGRYTRPGPKKAPTHPPA